MTPNCLHILGTVVSFTITKKSTTIIIISWSEWSVVFSIAGNAPPASCVFSQVMNLAAFVGKVMWLDISY